MDQRVVMSGASIETFLMTLKLCHKQKLKYILQQKIPESKIAFRKNKTLIRQLQYVLIFLHLIEKYIVE